MAPKHLKFESASDSEEETPMEVKKQKDPPAESSSEEEESSDDEGEKPLEKKETASQVVDAASQAVKTPAVSSEEEEESSEEEDSSDDEGEKPLEKKETASQVVVAAATTAKRKAVLSAEEEEEDGDKEKKIKKKATSSEVVVVAQARSDMAEKKKKKKKVTFSNEAVKHQRKKAKISEEENAAVVVEPVNVKKEEIGGASSEKKLFQPLLKEKDQLRFLQVVLDFKNDKGKKPVDDKIGFYKSIKDVVEAKNISLNQCLRQVKTFREKHKKKVLQGKAPSSSSNSHDKRFFELGKEIWGTKFVAVEKTRKSDRVKIKEERDMINVEQDGGGDWFGKSKDLIGLVTAFGIEEDWMKRMWSSVQTKKKRKMEQKWKVLKKKEFEMVTNKTSFVHEMVSMMSEASTQ